MKKSSIIAGAVLSLMALDAVAHAHLKSSNPKDGSTVEMMPPSIALTFSESARITMLSLQKDQEARQTLTPPTDSGETLHVSVPTLSPGAYTLRWRVLSTDDNHIMAGELHFKVAPMSMPMSH